MQGTNANSDEGWRSWLGVVAPVLALAIAFVLMSNRPAYCTEQEGLCTTTPCSCADPAQQLRDLRTPEGLQCWHCVAICPSQVGSRHETNSSDAASCYPGNCECADPTQERVRAEGSSLNSPCWRCVAPSHVVSLQGPDDPSESCLIRAPRSRLLAASASRAGSTTGAAAVAGPTAAGSGTPGPLASPPGEPLLRLVLTAEDAALPNASCAAFVREGLALREKNTSLCLSWNSLGAVWGLGKCASAGSPEAEYQSFDWVDMPESGAKNTSTQGFCATSGKVDSFGGAACQSIRHHVCPTDAGVCTPRECECEEKHWIKHELPLRDSGVSCWSCAAPVIPYCSTQPGTCTATPCECEDPSHEKITSNTTEMPLRTCWSCRPPSGRAALAGSALTGALVGIFLCGLFGGRFLRSRWWGEEPLQGFAVSKGKRKGRTTILRPLSWSERLALEFEEIWCTLEDGVSLLYQVVSMPAKPLRRWRRQAARAATGHYKGLSNRVHAVVACAREAISARLPQQQEDQQPEHSAAASRSVRKGAQQPERHDQVEQPQQQKQPKQQEQQQQQETKTHEEARDEPSTGNRTDAQASDAASASQEVAPVLQSPRPADSAQGTKQTDEAVRRRRRPKKKGGGEQNSASVEEVSGKTEPAALEEAEPEEGTGTALQAPEECPPSGGVAPEEPDAQHIQQEDQKNEAQADEQITCSWDPLADPNYERRCHVQHSRLLMLLSNTRHAGLKVDKRSLAANWLITYYVTPANKMANQEEAGPTARKGKKKKRLGVKNGPVVQEHDKADSGWDPLGSGCDCTDVTEKHIGSFQHARLLMLLSNARHAGTPYCKRTLAATWLTIFHMPDAHRCL